jgi:hypothetical protein
MKKHIKYLILIAGFLVAITACEDHTSFHESYLADGPITYRAQPDTLIFAGGNQKAKISWSLNNDQRITKTIITWNNGEGRKEVDIESENRPDLYEILVDNLDEGGYRFDIVNMDDKGNTSIVSSIFGEVFGETYISGLINRSVISEVKPFNWPEDPYANSGAVIEFTGAPEGLVSTNFEYKKMDGSTANVTVLPTETILSLEDIDVSQPVFVSSGYKPSENALETIFTSPLEIMLERKWNVARGKLITASSNPHDTYPIATDGSRFSRWPTFFFNWPIPVPERGKDVWIELDLGAVYDITEMVTVDRADCCRRNDNFHIFISEVPFEASTVAGIQAQEGVVDIYHEGLQDLVHTFSDINASGRYIRIQNALLEDDFLGLGELEIYN